MGLQIGELVPKREIKINSLAGKIIAVDAFNTIYQFLSNIRQADGTPLQDSKGYITSHLSGLFYRTTNLMSQGLRLIYVFDGKPPELKALTNKEREEKKREAEKKFQEAKREGKEEEMFKYARQNIRLTEEMIEESKNLLIALGVPVIQAPGEGEAQAAFIAKKEAYAVSSQDYDCLLFGAPRLIQNLTLSRKRKLVSGASIPIEPELIELENVLNSLQINLEQLICLGILTGTDFNPGGIKGIGPKKALIIVQKYKQPFLIFQAVEKQYRELGLEISFDWRDIFELFKKPNIVQNYNLDFQDINEEKVKKLLCEKHDFSEERVSSALKKLSDFKQKGRQQDLNKWF